MASELNLRTCGKAGCRWPAAASLSFRYETREVWLLDLAAEPHPTLYDLCPDHADALTVPRGWARVDERAPSEPLREPSGRDLDERAGEAGEHAGEPVGVGSGNRYAALAAELPRLARQYGGARSRTQPVPSRDLAPLPAGEHPGQLAIPVGDPDDAPPGDAVVVSMDGRRRDDGRS